MVPLSMIFSNILPGFQGHDIFEVEYLKNGASQGRSYYSTLIGSHIWLIEWYHVWLTSKRVARFVSISWVSCLFPVDYVQVAAKMTRDDNDEDVCFHWCSDRADRTTVRHSCVFRLLLISRSRNHRSTCNRVPTAGRVLVSGRRPVRAFSLSSRHHVSIVS